MKKIISKAFFLSILAIGVIAFVGCDKEELREDVTENTNSKNNIQKLSNELRTFYDDGKEVWCEGTGGNCLPTIIVRPKISKIIDEIHEVKDNNQIISIVKENLKDLSKFLKQDLLNEVILGGLTIVIRRGKDYTTSYVLFKNFNDDIVSVQPLRL